MASWPAANLRRVPIYEYKCPKGHVFELFHGINDPPPETCTTCDASPVTRVLHPVAVHFKGSGFYSTDYGRGGRKRDGTRDADAAPTADDAKKPGEAKKAPEKADTAKAADA